MTTAYMACNGIVVRLSDGACIPDDDGNDDYARYIRDAADNAGDPNYVAVGYDPRESLADAQASALAAVDSEAERIRLKYITPGVGQAQVYVAKLQQALEYQAATGNRDITKWELLSADVDATGRNPAAAVAAIINANKTWLQVAAKIERIRLRCKQQIDAATTHAEVQAARDDGLTKLRADAKQ